MRRGGAAHLNPVLWTALYHVRRNDAVSDDVCVIVYVLKKAVQGGEALCEALDELTPLGAG